MGRSKPSLPVTLQSGTHYSDPMTGGTSASRLLRKAPKALDPREARRKSFGNSSVLIDPPREDLQQAALRRFAGRAQQLAGVCGQVDVLITDNYRLRELNRRFRHKNGPTDVLSFPRPGEGGGDIAISAEIAAQNAVRYDHTMHDELKVLILHGMLHLAGYDHERDNGEMAGRESRLRARMGLPTALIERSRKRLQLPKLP
jgi:probable rRNA maturation factor